MDLTNLTPDQIASLKAQLASTDATGRSPMRPRQLNDLRLLPTATDPRPTFFWSAETPRDYVPHPYQEFPKLMWHLETGEEITVQNAVDERAHADAYGTMPPEHPVAQTPMDAMRDALDGLTEEERALIIEGQKKERMAAIQAKLAALPADTLEALLAQSADQATGKRRGKKPAA